MNNQQAAESAFKTLTRIAEELSGPAFEQCLIEGPNHIIGAHARMEEGLNFFARALAEQAGLDPKDAPQLKLLDRARAERSRIAQARLSQESKLAKPDPPP